MAKIKDHLEKHPFERISATDKQPENPFALKYDECGKCPEDCENCKIENRIPKIEMPPKNWSSDVMNKIIWGDNKHFYE